ncbi:MAG: diaminopimelate epimerase [Sphingomonas sp.]|nr:diaminopimelate epimerase [Sphingomonas sp.]
MRIAFTKCHGSGNDFALIDARAGGVADAHWAGIARALADRAGPVGSDGLLLLTAGDAACAFGMRMFNADGSEAETCLNGLRCVARAGFAALGGAAAAVRLKTSVAQVAIADPLAPGVATIRETVGPADLDAGAWPLAGAAQIIEAPVPQLPSARRFTAVAMPNPHLVSFVDAVDDAELRALGGICEGAPDWLPNRANVSFVEVRGGDLFVRTFERGVGLTNACGSAMAAATFAAGLTKRVGFDLPLTVYNAGGLVRAEASAEGMVTLCGNATFEWAGSAEVDVARGLAGDLVIDRWYNDEIAAWAGVIDKLT